MATLKELRNRISSVTSTRRITSAMKMVAAAKLRRAQDAAEAARPYAERMERMLGSLAATVAANPESAPSMLGGTGKDDTHLIVMISSDRGLCGGFNSNLIRQATKMIAEQEATGKTVKIIVVGRKGVSAMRRETGGQLVEAYEELAKPMPAFDQAELVADKITNMFEAGEFDVCTVLYNKFVSALEQVVTPLQLIPFNSDSANDEGAGPGAAYEFEPDEEGILSALLPRNLAVQVYRSMLESFASEQGARMTAMDNATRNAGDMIESLSLVYNRTRQAAITSELIEIISGAEAL
ncbi:MAG: F0F1 ATP synthase subunit gamma [Pseudomonadota bacterium]|nr:F0F1 ATP synthase subunit gamma [Pseudomonadota bacterium]